MNIYQENGYKDRQDYLYSVAEDYGVDVAVVFVTAGLLGEREDFTGLITTIEDLGFGRNVEDISGEF